jgi:hypothetical protein
LVIRIFKIDPVIIKITAKAICFLESVFKKKIDKTIVSKK